MEQLIQMMEKQGKAPQMGKISESEKSYIQGQC